MHQIGKDHTKNVCISIKINLKKKRKEITWQDNEAKQKKKEEK